MKKKRSVRQGWTNNLFFINWIMAWVYTYICVFLSIMGNYFAIPDFSFVSVGLPLVWADVSVFTGFMVWKTKAENLKKMGDFDKVIRDDPDFEIID